MDYSKFVDAVLENDEPMITKQVKVITAVLIKFLTVRLNAPSKTLRIAHKIHSL